MNINGKKITQTVFAYDECHKMYILNEGQKQDAKEWGYKILPISKLDRIFNQSCGLRFISFWDGDSIVPQFENPVFS